MSVCWGRVVAHSTQKGNSCLDPGLATAVDEGPDRRTAGQWVLGTLHPQELNGLWGRVLRIHALQCRRYLPILPLHLAVGLGMFAKKKKKKSELVPHLETSLVENWQTLAVSSAESSSLPHSSDSISQIQIWSLVYSWSAKLLASGQQSTKQWLASQWLCSLYIRPT